MGPDHKIVRSYLARFPRNLTLEVISFSWHMVSCQRTPPPQLFASDDHPHSEWQQFALTYMGTAFCGYCQNILGYTVCTFSRKWRRRQEIENASLAPRDSRPQRKRRFPSITAEVWANRG